MADQNTPDDKRNGASSTGIHATRDARETDWGAMNIEVCKLAAPVERFDFNSNDYSDNDFESSDDGLDEDEMLDEAKKKNGSGKIRTLDLDVNYGTFSRWTVSDGIREIFQNW
jgi:hypothetical protein